MKERVIHFFISILLALFGNMEPLAFHTAYGNMAFTDYSEQFTNKKRGGFAAGVGRTFDPVEKFIGFAIIIVAIYILAGGATGNTGIFGNATAANRFRDAGVVIASFASLVGLMLAVAIVRSVAK